MADRNMAENGLEAVRRRIEQVCAVSVSQGWAQGSVQGSVQGLTQGQDQSPEISSDATVNLFSDSSQESAGVILHPVSGPPLSNSPAPDSNHNFINYPASILATIPQTSSDEESDSYGEVSDEEDESPDDVAIPPTPIIHLQTSSLAQQDEEIEPFELPPAAIEVRQPQARPDDVAIPPTPIIQPQTSSLAQQDEEIEPLELPAPVGFTQQPARPELLDAGRRDPRTTAALQIISDGARRQRESQDSWGQRLDREISASFRLAYNVGPPVQVSHDGRRYISGPELRGLPQSWRYDIDIPVELRDHPTTQPSGRRRELFGDLSALPTSGYSIPNDHSTGFDPSLVTARVQDSHMTTPSGHQAQPLSTSSASNHNGDSVSNLDSNASTQVADEHNRTAPSLRRHSRPGHHNLQEQFHDLDSLLDMLPDRDDVHPPHGPSEPAQVQDERSHAAPILCPQPAIFPQVTDNLVRAAEDRPNEHPQRTFVQSRYRHPDESTQAPAERDPEVESCGASDETEASDTDEATESSFNLNETDEGSDTNTQLRRSQAPSPEEIDGRRSRTMSASPSEDRRQKRERSHSPESRRVGPRLASPVRLVPTRFAVPGARLCRWYRREPHVCGTGRCSYDLAASQRDEPDVLPDGHKTGQGFCSWLRCKFCTWRRSTGRPADLASWRHYRYHPYYAHLHRNERGCSPPAPTARPASRTQQHTATTSSKSSEPRPTPTVDPVSRTQQHTNTISARPEPPRPGCWYPRFCRSGHLCSNCRNPSLNAAMRELSNSDCRGGGFCNCGQCSFCFWRLASGRPAGSESWREFGIWQGPGWRPPAARMWEHTNTTSVQPDSVPAGTSTYLGRGLTRLPGTRLTLESYWQRDTTGQQSVPVTSPDSTNMVSPNAQEELPHTEEQRVEIDGQPAQGDDRERDLGYESSGNNLDGEYVDILTQACIAINARRSSQAQGQEDADENEDIDMTPPGQEDAVENEDIDVTPLGQENADENEDIDMNPQTQEGANENEDMDTTPPSSNSWRCGLM